MRYCVSAAAPALLAGLMMTVACSSQQMTQGRLVPAAGTSAESFAGEQPSVASCSHFKGQRLYTGYIARSDTNNVAVFNATKADGPATPICTIVNHWGLIGGFMVDSKSRLWLTDEWAPAVEVFDHATTGTDVQPVQKIAGSNTLLLTAQNTPLKGLAQDPATGNVWVANSEYGGGGGYLTAYSSDASGNVAPVATIGYGDLGRSQGFFRPSDVKFDAYGNMFVSDSLRAFAFTPPFTDSSEPAQIFNVQKGDEAGHLGFDPQGNLYVAGPLSLTVYKHGLKSGGAIWYRAELFENYGIALDSHARLYNATAGGSVDVLKPHYRTYEPVRQIKSPIWSGGTPNNVTVGE